jgi:hypothetical protein
VSRIRTDFGPFITEGEYLEAVATRCDAMLTWDDWCRKLGGWLIELPTEHPLYKESCALIDEFRRLEAKS